MLFVLVKCLQDCIVLFVDCFCFHSDLALDLEAGCDMSGFEYNSCFSSFSVKIILTVCACNREGGREDREREMKWVGRR